MRKRHQVIFKTKSPMVLLFVITLLVISTLVTASAYFLRPSIELELKEKVTEKIDQNGVSKLVVNVSGRDVTIDGFVRNEETYSSVEKITGEIYGVREINNRLVIKNLPND